MNNDKSAFLSILQNSRDCVPVGDVRVKCKCILCGDSKRDPNKKRLYLKCDPLDVSEPITYICFNCGESGMLTVDMASQIIGELTIDEISLLKRINKTAMNDSGTVRVNKYKNSKEIDVKIPAPRKTENTIRKIKYMNKRIGTVVPLKDYERFKLIFSIVEFMQVNNLNVQSKYRNLMHLFERDYIGWLSVKNEYIILRDITGNNKFRYVKFNIFGMESDAHSFFTVKNGINVISHEPIHIVAAEGPFDIMSLVYNVYGEITPNMIFMSTNHGAFYNPLLYYINKGIVGSNVYIDIYKDSDSIMDYELLKEQMKIYTKNFSVFQNAIGKDFGVPKEEFQVEKVM